MPNIEECERIKNVSTLSVESLVRMKLTSFRDKDRMHLRDMLDVELIDDRLVATVLAGVANSAARVD